MKKLTWTWQKIVTLIGTFLGIGTLVSCYGVVPSMEVHSLSGTIVDDEDKPVQGIKVSVISPYDSDEEQLTDFEYEDSTFSNEDGSYSLKWEYAISTNSGKYTFLAEDVDGEENGSFEDSRFEVDYSHVSGFHYSSDSKITHYDVAQKKITLTKKADNNE